MRFPNRPDSDHGTLLLLEVIAILVWAVATVVVLLLASGVLGALRFVADVAGASATVLDVGWGVVTLVAALVIVSAGGLAVIGYRHAFAALLDDVRPLPIVIAPAIGIVVPVGYVAATSPELALPLWAFVIVASSAHALAFRVIAVESMLEDRELASVLIGVGTGIPAVTALVTVVADVPLVGDGVAVQTLAETVAASGIPLEQSLLLAVPLLVAAGYGVRELHDRWSESTTQRPSGTVTRDASKVIRRQVFDDSSHPEKGGTRRKPVVPSSPSEGRSRRRSGSSRGGSRSTPTRDDGASNGSSTGGTRSGGEKRKRPSGTGAVSSTSESRSPGAANSSRSADSSPSSPDRRNDASSPPSDDDGSSEGTGSDTRIFVDDIDQYGSGADPTGTCPDCNEEIPSDGAYTFCPFCGCEL